MYNIVITKKNNEMRAITFLKACTMYLEIFKYHAEKNVSIIFEIKRQKKYFVEKQILTVNLSLKLLIISKNV